MYSPANHQYQAATPPINISSTPPIKRYEMADPDDIKLPPPKLDFGQLAQKAARKKRKKRTMKPGAPAVTTIRGFHTPVTSGGEESDCSAMSTPRMRAQDLPSITSSPAMRPLVPGGISALKMQLDHLNISSESPKSFTSLAMQRVASNASSYRSGLSSAGSDSDRAEMDSYEINLEQDFISREVSGKSGSLQILSDDLRGLSLTRKMTAADFECINCLGKGTYGTVLLVKQRETGRLYAQKQFRKASLTVHKKLVEQTKTERVILESVNRHPFVVKLYYAFQDREKLYLILEYAQGGELFHHLAMERMFTEEVAAFYMAEMVLALEHLHRTVGVVYRDLKPENCLLDSEGHLLLTDFGLSKVSVDADATTCNSILGTIEYMAPEVIQGMDYGAAVDWWSLGALGYDLLTGSPPFQGPNHAKTQEKILKAKLTLPYFLGPDAKDLLTRLLRKDPRKRLGGTMPKDLRTIKSHRFFRRINWSKLAKRDLEPPIKPLITNPELAENFSKEFTDLPLSPATRERSMSSWTSSKEVFTTNTSIDDDLSDPFGGFSFVASQSLLDSGDWCV